MTDDQTKHLKQNFSYVKSKVKQRWLQLIENKKCFNFEEYWLQETFKIPIE